MIRAFGRSTDEVWKAYGRDDPYFGVLSHEEYSRHRLSDVNLDKFFLSGEKAVAELLSSIAKLGISLRMGRALDFGCGVGRLTIPLAKRFKDVNGVDISEGMLSEGAKNLMRRSIVNVTLSTEIPDLAFDFVHSALVFQHINAKRGTEIILDLWSKVTDSGLFAFQIPIRYRGNWAAWQLRQIRTALPALQILYNIISRRRWNKPGMQMNIYDLNLLVAALLEAGASQIAVQRLDSDVSFFGVYVFAIRGPSKST